MSAMSEKKQAEEVAKGTPNENRKKKMVANSAEGGESSQSPEEDQKVASVAASNTLGTRNDAATTTGCAQANEDAKESEGSTSEQQAEGEDNPALEIPMNSFEISFLTNKLERVELPEQYEQLASYVWRISKDGPVLVVPGTPPALVAWEGGHLRGDRKTPARSPPRPRPVHGVVRRTRPACSHGLYFHLQLARAEICCLFTTREADVCLSRM